MAKVRVYELARELGRESKEVLAVLKDMGEFVSSASSTVEAPVVRRLRDKLADGGGKKKKDAGPVATSSTTGAVTTTKGPKPKPRPRPQPKGDAAAKPAPAAKGTPAAKGAPAAKAEPSKPAAPKPTGKVAPSVPADKPAARPSSGAAKPGAPKPGAPRPGGSAKPGGSQGAAPKPGGAPRSGAPKPGTPRPGGAKPGAGSGAPKPGAPKPRPAGKPRPGNNPFSSKQGMGVRRPDSGERPGGPRPPARPAPRPGMPRPNPGMMPKQANDQLGARSNRPGGRGRPGGGGGRPGGGGGRPGGGGGRPGGGGPRTGAPGGPGGFPPAPAGRGGRGGRGTQGAFGRSGPGGRRGRKSRKQRRQEFDQMEAPTIGGVRIRSGGGATIRLRRGASLSDLAEKISVEPAELVKVLFSLGEMVTATQSVPDETLQILGAELDYNIQVVSPEDEDRELLERFDIEFGEDLGDEDDLASRPPVVTVMGHVDHGKTKLLDALRNSNVVAGEAGGITQAIGAYQIATEVDDVERPITFIDTPGHEAFTAMRARGAKSTDIAVLVVAADDGVMPQTIEALNHALAAEVPVVVAVNKVDKPEADPQKVRGQLTEYQLVPEEYGGDTMFVDVSAVSGQGLDDLLEAIILTADAALDLRANPDMPAQGVAIEAHLDRGRGPVATALIHRGTLKLGDSIVAGSAHGRVRAMINDLGETVTEASPSMPVQVLGLTSVPGAGDNLLVVEDDRMARQIGEQREARMRMAAQAKSGRRKTLDQLFEQMEKGETQELLLILKGDSAGSVEALEEALTKIEVSDEVSIRVIDRGVGAITETNVSLAAAADQNAVILGFNVRAQGKATEMADRENVDIRYYSVIYDAIDEIEAALKGMLKPIYEESQLGTAEVREIFKSSKVGTIAGCVIQSGTIRRNTKARLLRDSVVVAETEINTIRREKDDVTEVREGFECGITLKNYSDIKVGDIIETHEMVEKERE